MFGSYFACPFARSWRVNFISEWREITDDPQNWRTRSKIDVTSWAPHGTVFPTDFARQVSARFNVFV